MIFYIDCIFFNDIWTCGLFVNFASDKDIGDWFRIEDMGAGLGLDVHIWLRWNESSGHRRLGLSSGCAS